MTVLDTEIRVRVTRQDIDRAYEQQDSDEAIFICPVAQALIRMGFLGVEVHDQNVVYIGMDRYEAIDERPIGEQLSRFTEDFDESAETEREPEPTEFVLRRVP